MQDRHEKVRTPNHSLRQQREWRGWSHREVALKLQDLFPEVAVTANDVRRWENGERRPGPYYRPKLCVLFGATEEQLGLTPQDVSCDQNVKEGETDEQEEGQNTSPQDPPNEDVIGGLKELLHQQQAMMHQTLCQYEQNCQQPGENDLGLIEVIKDLAEHLRSEKPHPAQSQPDLSLKGPPASQEAREAQIEIKDSRSTGESLPFTSFFLSQTIKRGIIEAVRELGETPNQGKTGGVLRCPQDVCPFLNQAGQRSFSHSEALAEEFQKNNKGIRESSYGQ